MFRENLSLIILVASYLLVGCSPPKSQLAGGKNSGNFTLNFSVDSQSAELASNDPFVVYLLSRKGEMIEVKKVEAKDFSNISITIEEQYLIQDSESSFIDNMTSVGQNAPSLEHYKSSDVSQEIFAFIQVIVLQGQLTSGSFGYWAEEIFPITQANLFNEKSKYSNKMLLTKGKVISVSVLSESDEKVIAGTSVVPLFLGKVKSEGEEIAKKHFSAFRPFPYQTSKEGVVNVVVPENESFQLYAYKDGYCIHSSDDLRAKIAELNEYTAKMRLCDGDSNLKIAFPRGVKTIEFSLDGQTTQGLATNQNTVQIYFDVSKPVSAPIKMQLSEVTESGEESIISTTIMDAFYSTYNLAIPEVFTLSESQNGFFKISFMDSLTQKEIGNNLFGKKNLSSPGLSFMDDLKIASSSGVNGILSGAKDSKIIIDAVNCKDSERLALQVLSDEKKYFNCTGGEIRIVSGDLSLETLADSGATKVPISFFKEDVYGNISESDPDGGNIMDVTVNFEKPSLEFVYLGLQFGFVPADAALATNLNIDNYPQGVIVDGDYDTMEISISNLQNYVMRFSSPDNCTTETGSENPLKKIYSLSLSKTFEVSQAATESTQCVVATGESTSHVVLNSESFSQDGNSYITYLKIWDVSMHESLPLKIEIPKCPVDKNYKDLEFCWIN